MYEISIALGAFLAIAQASPVAQPLEARGDSDSCVISAWWHHDHTITPDLGSGSGPIDRESDQYSLTISKNGAPWWNTTSDKLLGSTSYTIKTSDTGLSQDIAWAGSNFDGWQWCECTYGSGSKNHSTAISKTGSQWFTTTTADQTCDCGFPCGTGTTGPQVLTPASSLDMPTPAPAASNSEGAIVGAGLASVLASQSTAT